MTKAKSIKKKKRNSKKEELDLLKGKVYQLAHAKDTKGLKASNHRFNSLDFRKPNNWELAFKILKEYEQSNSDTPEEYRELFDEIDQVNKEAKASILKSRQTFQNIEQSLSELDALTEETQKDTESLRQEKVISIPISISQSNRNQAD